MLFAEESTMIKDLHPAAQVVAIIAIAACVISFIYFVWGQSSD